MTDDRPDERGYRLMPPAHADEPRPVIPLAYAAPPQTVPPLWRSWPVFAAWAMTLIAFFVMLWDIETVLASGPILAATGSTMIGVGIWKRRQTLTVAGGSLCAICLLFWTCVVMFGWSPRRAEIPFAVMGTTYVIGLSAFCMIVIMKHRERTGRMRSIASVSRDCL